jgi:hypothetical protein
MKRTKFAAVLMAMVLCIAPAAFSKEQQQSQISGTYRASCVIRIIADRQVISPNLTELEKYLSSVLQSSGVGTRAAKDILGYEEITDETLQNIITITFLHGQAASGYDYSYSLGLKIDASNAPKPAAEEFMHVLIDGLKKNLDKSFTDYRDRLNQQIKIAEENADQAERDFYIMQERLRKLSDSRDLSRQTIFADINSLRKQIDEQKMDILRFEAYLGDLPKQIQNIQQQVEEKIRSDAVLRELSQMVENQQRQVNEIRKVTEKENIPVKNLAEAEEKLARDRIELANRKEMVQRTAGGDRIEQLNQEIADLSSRRNRDLDLSNVLQRRLDEAKQLLEKADEYEVLSIKADIAKQSLRRALEMLDFLKRGAAPVPPTITVMGD